MKYFINEQCLKEHGRSRHQYIVCDKCGIKQLKKNIKSHLQIHKAETLNRNQHIKVVHLEFKPHSCSIPGCFKKFAYKHVRDNHENSGCHIYVPGNFEESDEQFRSRPRGGKERKYPIIETLMRKRVILNEGA
ncbi:zinc finger protein [Dorcoceras hygrometricum]|nr:zinc finger protein [Dorcoceras hygrometricum]